MALSTTIAQGDAGHVQAHNEERTLLNTHDDKIAANATKLNATPIIVKAASGSYPARPTADIVIWKGAADPGTLAINGDYWDDVD